MIINIILYIFLGVGVGYFIYLIYKKWPELQKQEKPKLNLSVDNFKALPSKLKVKRINLKTIKLFFIKMARSIKVFVKKSLIFDRDVMSTVVKKIKESVLNIKLPKEDKINFEMKSLNGTKDKIDKVSLKKKIWPNIRKVFHKQKDNITKVQKSTFNLFKKIKKVLKKVSFQKLLIFLKTLQKKIKVHFMSQEDERAKKRFQASEIKQKTQKEAYLGDLLKKTLPTKKEEKELKKPEPIIQENILEKETIEQKSRRPKTLQEGLNKINQLKDQPASLKREASQEQVSQETLNKIEQDLVKQILADPKNIEAYKKLGKLYYNREQFDYAKESFEAALKLGSGDNKIKELLKECESKLRQ